LPRVSLTMWTLLICLCVLSIAQAVNPPPGGGYPGGNTAAGANALLNLTDGRDNTALGAGTLERDTDGRSNTAVGTGALFDNRLANQNTGTGVLALESNRFDNGPDNTAYGYRALDNNNGTRNTAIGWNALVVVFEGTDNIALGHSAGRNLSQTDSNNIEIGNRGVAGENRVLRIGDADQVRTFVAGITGALVAGAPVVVNSAGQLGTAPSSACFKDEIKPMGKRSEAIFGVNPVTFRYKKELDPHGTLQFGLVAEEVEKVDPDLVVRTSDGKPYTVRYEAVNAMLLNEFLKQHHRVQSLESGIAQLTARFDQQDAKIQQVSAQLEASKPPPQVVTNP